MTVIAATNDDFTDYFLNKPINSLVWKTSHFLGAQGNVLKRFVLSDPNPQTYLIYNDLNAEKRKLQIHFLSVD